MGRVISRFLSKGEGATAVEYAFIASMIAVAIVGVLLTLGPTLSNAFQTVQNDL
jgi:pilus assembly protein Flp/PilA